MTQLAIDYPRYADSIKLAEHKRMYNMRGTSFFIVTSSTIGQFYLVAVRTWQRLPTARLRAGAGEYKGKLAKRPQWDGCRKEVQQRRRLHNEGCGGRRGTTETMRDEIGDEGHEDESGHRDLDVVADTE
ncbi:hypothetical protein B0H13DRAFT_1865163 [Mycena leptocephala]|nr:hypothetical protein B0H13DRAFT_1865163 [Mycena leptocephala]